VNESSGSVDVLTLIGSAIGQLQQSIQHLDAANPETGLACLSTVITDIDVYLEHLADDPLVPLAQVDPGKVRETLHLVQDDLASIITQIRHAAMP